MKSAKFFGHIRDHLPSHILVSLSHFSHILSQVFCLLSHVSVSLLLSPVSHLLSPVLCLLSISCLTSPVSVFYVSFLLSLSHVSCLTTYFSCPYLTPPVSQLMSPVSHLGTISHLLLTVSCLTSPVYCLSHVIC